MSSSPVGGAERESVMEGRRQLKRGRAEELHRDRRRGSMKSTLCEKVHVMSERDRVIQRRRQLNDTA